MCNVITSWTFNFSGAHLTTIQTVTHTQTVVLRSHKTYHFVILLLFVLFDVIADLNLFFKGSLLSPVLDNKLLRC